MTIIDTDILNYTTDGFQFTTPNEKVTVNPNVSVISKQRGIYSNNANSTLVNKGTVIGDVEGVKFDVLADTSTITNALGALIAGDRGVEMLGHGTQTFNNFGTDIGTESYGVLFNDNVLFGVFNNHGKVFAADTAVKYDVGGTVNNFASLKGGQFGVNLGTSSSNIVVTINNKASGLIHGGVDSIHSNEGAFVLNNFGKLFGDVIGSVGAGLAANDVVRNHSVIHGQVNLGDGDDFFRNVGNAKSGPVFGGAGNDSLIGGNRSDELHGGDGTDLLKGNKGADHFVFDTALNAVTNVDTIADFKPSQQDQIWVSHTVFMGLTQGFLDAAHFSAVGPVGTNPQIDYTQATGQLFFDPDGTGPGAPILFAIAANHANIQAGDILVI